MVPSGWFLLMKRQTWLEDPGVPSLQPRTTEKRLTSKSQRQEQISALNAFLLSRRSLGLLFLRKVGAPRRNYLGIHRQLHLCLKSRDITAAQIGAIGCRAANAFEL